MCIDKEQLPKHMMWTTEDRSVCHICGLRKDTELEGGITYSKKYILYIIFHRLTSKFVS